MAAAMRETASELRGLPMIATHVELVAPYEVADGETVRPIPDQPGSDGVVSWTAVDEHEDWTYYLTDGRSYFHMHGTPVAVVRPDVPGPGEVHHVPGGAA